MTATVTRHEDFLLRKVLCEYRKMREDVLVSHRVAIERLSRNAAYQVALHTIDGWFAPMPQLARMTQPPKPVVDLCSRLPELPECGSCSFRQSTCGNCEPA